MVAGNPNDPEQEQKLCLEGKKWLADLTVAHVKFDLAFTLIKGWAGQSMRQHVIVMRGRFASGMCFGGWLHAAVTSPS